MPSLNRSLVGLHLPVGEPYEVALEHVRAFASALGDENALYRDPAAARAAGYPHAIAPPTFAQVVSAAGRRALFAHPELGLRYERILHSEQRFRYERPIVVGDVLTTAYAITEIALKGRHELLAWDAEIRDAEGELVCTASGSILSRETA
jgi:acyl dehydratase